MYLACEYCVVFVMFYTRSRNLPVPMDAAVATTDVHFHAFIINKSLILHDVNTPASRCLMPSTAADKKLVHTNCLWPLLS